MNTPSAPAFPSSLVGAKIYFIVGNPGLCDPSEPLPLTIAMGYPDRERVIDLAMGALNMMKSLGAPDVLMQFKVVEMQFDRAGVLVPTGNDETFTYNPPGEAGPKANMPPASA